MDAQFFSLTTILARFIHANGSDPWTKTTLARIALQLQDEENQ